MQWLLAEPASPLEAVSFTEGKPGQRLMAAFVDANLNDNLDDFTVTVHWGDHSGKDQDVFLVRDATDPNIVDVNARIFRCFRWYFLTPRAYNQ